MTSGAGVEPSCPSEPPLEESNPSAQELGDNVTHWGSLWAALLLPASRLYGVSRRRLLQYSRVSVFITLLLLGSRIELEYHQLHEAYTHKRTAGGRQRPNKIGYKITLTTWNRGLCYKLCSSLLHAIRSLRSSCQQRMVFLWWQDVYS